MFRKMTRYFGRHSSLKTSNSPSKTLRGVSAVGSFVGALAPLTIGLPFFAVSFLVSKFFRLVLALLSPWTPLCCVVVVAATHNPRRAADAAPQTPDVPQTRTADSGRKHRAVHAGRCPPPPLCAVSRSLRASRSGQAAGTLLASAVRQIVASTLALSDHIGGGPRRDRRSELLRQRRTLDIRRPLPRAPLATLYALLPHAQ